MVGAAAAELRGSREKKLRAGWIGRGAVVEGKVLANSKLVLSGWRRFRPVAESAAQLRVTMAHRLELEASTKKSAASNSACL